MILHDPGTIGLLIGGFLASGGGFGIIIGAVGQAIGWGLIIGITAYGSINARRQLRHQQADAKAAYNASLTDRTATLLTATPAWRVVYGRSIVGCDIVAIFTSDKQGYRENGTTYTRADAYKHLVVHIASHQIAAIHEVYVNGIALGPLDGNGIPTSSSDFYRVSQHSYFAVVGGDGTVNVAPPAASILAGTIGEISVVTDTLQNVTGLCAITNGGNTITGPVGAGVTYVANIGHWSLRVQLHLGSSTQTVDTYLNGVVPSQWTANHRLRGRAYAVITLDLEDPRFQGGPPGFTFDVSGRILTHATYGDAAHHNAALVIKDFLQQPWGYNTSASSLVATSWDTAVTDCDARLSGTTQTWATATFTASAANDTITFAADLGLNTGDGVRFTTNGTLPTASGGDLAAGITYYIVRQRDNRTYKLARTIANAWAGTTIDITGAGSGVHTGLLYDYAAYTINGMFFTSESREALLEEFSRAMGGTVTNIGRWYAFAGTWHASVMDLTDDDLDGAISLPSCDTELDSLINGQRGQFVPVGTSTPIEYDPYQNATFRTADGEDLYDDFNYRWTNNRYRCRNLSRIRTEQLRSGQQLSYPAKLPAIQLQPGDRVRVTSGELAVTNKYYRVTDTQFGYTSPIGLMLIEDDSTIWDLADATVADPTPNSGLPSRVVSVLTLTPAPFADSTTGVRNADGSWTPRIKVSWSAITDPYMADSNAKVWVGWRLNSDTVWNWTAVPPDQRYVFLSGFSERQVVIVQAYAQNQMGDKGPSSYDIVAVAFTQADPGWVTNGTGCRVSGGRAWKDQQIGSVSDGWNAGVYGKNPSPTGACEVSGVLDSVSTVVMLGLATSPAASANYTDIEYSLYATGSHYEVYESGVQKASTGTQAAGDRLAVRYTGCAIVYYVNQTIIRRVPVALNKTLYPDSSFYSIGGSVSQLSFDVLTPRPAEYQVSAAGLDAITAGVPADCTFTLRHVDSQVDAVNGSAVAYGRSYMMARIARNGANIGTVTFMEVYDVYASATVAGNLATDLNNTTTDYVVVVWTYDEPYNNRFANGLEAAMYRCGASRQIYGPDAFKSRGAYILIGIAGCGEGQAEFESYRGAIAGDPSAWLLTTLRMDSQGKVSAGGMNTLMANPGYGGGNLLLNSSFEVDSDNDGSPDSWTAYSGGTTGSVGQSLTSGGVAGSKYLTLTATNLGTSSSDTVGRRQIVETEGFRGQHVIFSLMVYGGGAGTPDLRMYLDYYTGAGAGGSLISSDSVTFDSPAAGWQRYYLYSRLPTNCVSVALYFWMEARTGSAGSAAMLFDAAQFEVAAVPTAYAGNAMEAAAAALGAQLTANTKNVTFVQASTPTALAAGDLWFDSDDGYKLYRAGGPGTGSWTAYQFDTAAIASGATSNAPVVTTIADDFDDALTSEGPFTTYRTYEDGDGLRSVGSITPYGTSKVNIVVTGAIRVHIGDWANAVLADITVNLRNGTTVIDSTYGRAAIVTRYDPVGTGKSVEIPVALSWQGDLSSATTFNVDVVCTPYQSDGSTAANFNGAVYPGYVLFNLKSTIVNYKR